MKKWFIHILLLAGLFGMLTTSCSQDEEIANIPSAGTPSEKVTIRFTLDLGEQGGMSSRATWGGYDGVGTDDSDQAVPGIDNENAIDNIQVFMFSTDGAYIGGLKDMEYERQDNSNIYNIKGEVDVVKTAIGTNEVLNCKIMVVANADAATEVSGKVTDYNNAATFNHNVSYIPMWGIGTYSINLIQQLQVDLDEPIYMLRSMAKIEVTLNQTIYAKGYRITSATLNKYNTQGYVVPTLPVTTGDNPVVDWNNLTNTTSLSTANVFRENESLAETASSPTPKSFAESEVGKSYVIYVPEYDNESELTITLGLTHNSTPIYKEGTTPYTISLNEYKLNNKTGKSEPDTEKPLDLVRNHWYQYTINSIDSNNGLECEVQDWNWQQEKLEYEDFVSVEEKINVIESAGTQTDAAGETHVKMKSKTLVYGNESATKQIYMVQLKFKIQTPTGYQWRASLIQDDMTRIFYFAETSKIVSDGKTTYPISVNADGNLTTSLTVSGQVGEEAVLTIVSEELNLINTVTARLQIMVLDSDVTSDYIIVEPEALGGNYYITQTP